MSKVVSILSVELLVTAGFAFALNNFRINYDFFTILGLGNLILGVIGAIAGLVALAAGTDKDKSILITSGLLLLIGCITCSIFPFQLNSKG